MRSRIEEVIERSGMSQSQFADFIEVKRPTLSHILAGRNNPSMEVVMKVHQKFPKINILWLLDSFRECQLNLDVPDFRSTPFYSLEKIVPNFHRLRKFCKGSAGRRL